MRHYCLAVVPPDRVTRLKELDPTTYRWIIADTWAEAATAIRGHPIDLSVLDPLTLGESGVTEVERLRMQFPSLPMVLYTTLSPATASVLLRLGRAGLRRVVFARFEDAPGTLRRAISKELEHATIQQIMRSLDTMLRNLPEALRLALEMSLHAPADRMNVAALAEQAHMSPRECQEGFARAGLPSPRVVMVLIRLLYTHRLLLDPGHTIDDIARKLGYAKPRTLQAQLRTVFGMTAGELRESLSPEGAAEALTRRYFMAGDHVIDAPDLIAAPG